MKRDKRQVRGFQEWQPAFTRSHIRTVGSPITTKHSETYQESVRNISTAYHPQMDGQSEKTNQHIETALQIHCNYQQNDWAHWLPIVQYAINARPSATTKQAPYELWMGFIPRAHQAERSSKVPTIELRREQIREARKQALEVMK